MYVGRLRLFFKIALSVFLVLICWLNWPRSHLWKVFLQVECSVVLVNLPFEQAMLTSIPKLNSQKTNKKNYYADKARSLTFGFVHNRFGNKIFWESLGLSVKEEIFPTNIKMCFHRLHIIRIWFGMQNSSMFSIEKQEFLCIHLILSHFGSLIVNLLWGKRSLTKWLQIEPSYVVVSVRWGSIL